MRTYPILALLQVALLGCASVGPARLGADHLQYTRAISDTQKRQILLNIVRLRYGDKPIFLAVNQVISSYTLERSAELGLNIYPNARPGNYATGLAGVNYSDHPTVTFAPLTGEELARMAIQPPAPADLLPLAQGGLPIDVLFRFGVQSVGHLQNTVVLGGQEGAGDPEFFELIGRMRQLQVGGILTVRFVRTKDRNQVFLGIADARDRSSKATAARTRQLIGMLPGQTEAEVVYGRVTSGPRQIAILTRPIIAILSQVSAEIDVPPEDVQAGRTISSVPSSRLGLNPIVRVHTGKAAPPNTDTAVRYRDAWFWIDDSDFNSKVAYTILGLLMGVVEGKAGGQAPVLTVPAG
ncbi:MAG: hypothetical protein JOY71_20620 [Acetobacteraceae bacterium]|nr:hypothetical protein [Acetobacteraceae bacterium]MBV8590965.1 hypothetical protein [Acetobacteraceae bacterium]